MSGSTRARRTSVRRTGTAAGSRPRLRDHFHHPHPPKADAHAPCPGRRASRGTDREPGRTAGAGLTSGDTDTCQGDSGGPPFRGGALAGITSRGGRPAADGRPAGGQTRPAAAP
ncbi:trypsin-like serine protease [Streptomyces sp. MS06]|uniref:trypsin-like serine protease n=1 Tax=Streptomyces sp. MS06 TaxID=3385974 RepID=UPI0039A30EE6